MAIELWEGTPGSGKTSSCIVDAIGFLQDGGVVFSNFNLIDGWAEVVASQDLKCRWGMRDSVEYATQLYKRWRTIGTVESCYEASKLIPGLVTGKIAKKFEGRALLILDEVQLVFNSRTWQGNMKWIEFFTQHRKLGFDVRLIAHDIEMVDSQIRPLVEYRVSNRNLAKVRVPVIGVPFSWFFGGGSVFLAIWRYAGKGAGAGMKVMSKTTRLCKWAYGLFDSHRVFSLDDQKASSVEFMGPSPARRAGGPPSSLTEAQRLELRAFFESFKAEGSQI